jgi:hypothetical protein
VNSQCLILTSRAHTVNTLRESSQDECGRRYVMVVTSVRVVEQDEVCESHVQLVFCQPLLESLSPQTVTAEVWMERCA